MSMTCTICRHPKRKEIERAMIQGISFRAIARHLVISKDAARRHRECMAEAYEKAKSTRMIDINAEFARTYATIRKIEAACDKWLTDPDNPDLYDVGVRASEVVVIYDRPIREGDKIRWERRREILQQLIDDAIRTPDDELPEPRLRIVESKRADVRKLIIETLQTAHAFIRTLGDLTGAFKQPQPNPRQTNKRLYDEWMDDFVKIYRRVDPNITRREVVASLKEMPATAGEFMPFVEAELAGESYLN